MSEHNRLLNENWPSTEEIRLAQAKVPIDRVWSLFDYSSCKHEVCQVNYAGDYETETCIDCGKQTYSRCTHKYNAWSPDDLLLRCKTCGMDVT